MSNNCDTKKKYIEIPGEVIVLRNIVFTGKIFILSKYFEPYQHGSSSVRGEARTNLQNIHE